MFEMQFNITDFENKAKSLVAAQDQVPFALSVALNEANNKTREHLITTTWPQHVKRYNAGFMRAALMRGPPAIKTDLQVSLFDALGRANLKLHADGGTKTPKRAMLAIPVKGNVRRTAHGFTPKPSEVPNAVIMDRVGKGPAIWSRVGKKLKMMYVLKRSVPIINDVPFRADYEESMRNEARIAFPGAMMRAVMSAK